MLLVPNCKVCDEYGSFILMDCQRFKPEEKEVEWKCPRCGHMMKESYANE